MQFATITVIGVLRFLQETFASMLETFQVVFLGKIWLTLLAGKKKITLFIPLPSEDKKVKRVHRKWVLKEMTVGVLITSFQMPGDHICFP